MASHNSGAKISPFPLDFLQVLHKEDIRTANQMARFSRYVEVAAGEAGGGISQLLRSYAKISVIHPSDSFSVSRSGGGAWQPCVAARIMLIEDDAQVLLLIPARFLVRILAKIFSTDPCDLVPDPALLEAVSSLIILEEISSLPAVVRPSRLAALSYTDDFSTVSAGGNFYFLNMKVTLDCGSDILTLLITERDLAKAEGALKQLAFKEAAGESVRSVNIPISLVCAAVELTSSQIEGLSSGDVLIPDTAIEGTVEDGPGRVHLAIAGNARYYTIGTGEVKGTAVRVERVYLERRERIMKKHNGSTNGDKTGLTAVDGEVPGAVRDVPVELVVEAGRIEVSVGELATLVPGSIITIDRPLSAEVTITSSGQMIARGMLVSVDGELGVQILKVNK